jgi:hypothetical protein
LPVGGWQSSTAALEVKFMFFASGNSAINDDLDLALCKPFLDVKQFTGNEPIPLSFETSLQKDGTLVAFTGFPLSFSVPITSRGAIATYRAKDTLGAAEMLIDKTAWPGASGSPVYLSNGKVVGVLIQIFTGQGSGLSVGRSSHLIEQFMASARQTK